MKAEIKGTSITFVRKYCKSISANDDIDWNVFENERTHFSCEINRILIFMHFSDFSDVFGNM